MSEHFALYCSQHPGCICRKCLYHASTRCPHGNCYDDFRTENNPYDKAHPGEPPRTAWSNWKEDQAYWCRGGIFYQSHECAEYVEYEKSKHVVKDCLDAVVSIFQDGYIECSLVESVGCEECMKHFEKKQERKEAEEVTKGMKNCGLPNGYEDQCCLNRGGICTLENADFCDIERAIGMRGCGFIGVNDRYLLWKYGVPYKELTCGNCGYYEAGGYSQGICTNEQVKPHTKGVKVNGDTEYIDSKEYFNGAYACKKFIKKGCGEVANTYYTKCGRIFKKNSTASVTGYELKEEVAYMDTPPYAGRITDDKCRICPFVIDVTEGWGENKTHKRFECRAGSKEPNNTSDWIGCLENKNTIDIRSLNNDFLEAIMEYCKADPELGAGYNQDLDDCRRNISVSCSQNKKGIAAKTALVEKFFVAANQVDVEGGLILNSGLEGINSQSISIPIKPKKTELQRRNVTKNGVKFRENYYNADFLKPYWKDGLYIRVVEGSPEQIEIYKGYDNPEFLGFAVKVDESAENKPEIKNQKCEQHDCPFHDFEGKNCNFADELQSSNIDDDFKKDLKSAVMEYKCNNADVLDIYCGFKEISKQANTEINSKIEVKETEVLEVYNDGSKCEKECKNNRDGKCIIEGVHGGALEHFAKALFDIHCDSMDKLKVKYLREERHCSHAHTGCNAVQQICALNSEYCCYTCQKPCNSHCGYSKELVPLGKLNIEDKRVIQRDPVGPAYIFTMEIDSSNQVTALNSHLQYIQNKCKDIVSNYVEIGFTLINIKDNKLFNARGYDNLVDCVEAELNMKKSTCYNLIKISEKFGDPETKRLKLEFNKYNYVQCLEMSTMTNEEVALVSPDMSKRDMKEFKISNRLENTNENNVGLAKLINDEKVIDVEFKVVKDNKPDPESLRIENQVVLSSLAEKFYNHDWETVSNPIKEAVKSKNHVVIKDILHAYGTKTHAGGSIKIAGIDGFRTCSSKGVKIELRPGAIYGYKYDEYNFTWSEIAKEIVAAYYVDIADSEEYPDENSELENYINSSPVELQTKDITNNDKIINDLLIENENYRLKIEYLEKDKNTFRELVSQIDSKFDKLTKKQIRNCLWDFQTTGMIMFLDE